jgi:hypothetical protein
MVRAGGDSGRPGRGEEKRRGCRSSRPAIARRGAACGEDLDRAAAARRRDQRQDTARRLGCDSERCAGREAESAAASGKNAGAERQDQLNSTDLKNEQDRAERARPLLSCQRLSARLLTPGHMRLNKKRIRL